MKNSTVGQFGGFTLIELLVVVLIIGILAAIVVPQYEMAVYKTRFNNVRTWVHSIRNAQEIYYMANNKYADNLEELDVAFPSGCQYLLQPQWDFDTLDCPDARVDISRTYHAITATVKKCPAYKAGCVSYVEPYSVPYRFDVGENVIEDIVGTGPNCVVSKAGGVPQKALEYGKKVCQALGGKERTPQSGRYYL